MKFTVEPTSDFCEVGGIKVREYRGTAENGVAITVHVAALAIEDMDEAGADRIKEIEKSLSLPDGTLPHSVERVEMDSDDEPMIEMSAFCSGNPNDGSGPHKASRLFSWIVSDNKGNEAVLLAAFPQGGWGIVAAPNRDFLMQTHRAAEEFTEQGVGGRLVLREFIVSDQAPDVEWIIGTEGSA